ncbi:hypothetical protein J1N35_042393 [Gossypium stocksii]|uniref:Uncharacterized protein n=1 Tax=Gossypium stocksii TaxID=47602 RepID=A0A9D3UHA7_9ROSI|nr:hypothetical protein J1N35_042393 [Gossypium stocksii]
MHSNVLLRAYCENIKSHKIKVWLALINTMVGQQSIGTTHATLGKILELWAHMPVWPTRPDCPCLCGSHDLVYNPHARVKCSCGPHDQLGLARVAYTATLQPPHGHVLRTAAPSSDTRSCLAHGQPHGQPHARVALIVRNFGFC